MADDLLLYPRGQIGFGSGNLKTATMGNFKVSNGAKLRHALAQSPAGVSLGAIDCTGTFSMEVSENGPERGVINDVLQGTPRGFRFKDATTTYEIKGTLNEATWDQASVDEPVKITANFVGKISIL